MKESVECLFVLLAVACITCAASAQTVSSKTVLHSEETGASVAIVESNAVDYPINVDERYTEGDMPIPVWVYVVILGWLVVTAVGVLTLWRKFDCDVKP